MSYLTTFAVVRGEFWLTQLPTVKLARECLERHKGQGFHLEQWDFPILPDGTHGSPFKRKLEEPCSTE